MLRSCRRGHHRDNEDMNEDIPDHNTNSEVDPEPLERGLSRTSGEDTPREAGGSGWSSTTQAARALGISSRTVRRYVEAGELVARKRPGKGSQSTLEIDIDSLQRLRMKRIAKGEMPTYAPAATADTDGGSRDVYAEHGDNLADIIERLSRSYADARADAASAQARLELTERAESSLREEVTRERQRAEEAEQRTHELQQELEEARRASRGFWSRLFGRDS